MSRHVRCASESGSKMRVPASVMAGRGCGHAHTGLIGKRDTFGCKSSASRIY